MIPQFLIRQFLNLAISSLVKLIDKYGHDFDAAKAKIYVKEQIENLVPPSLWGEKYVEEGLVKLTDAVVDVFAGGILKSSSIVGEVVSDLAGGNWTGAINTLRKFVLGLIYDQKIVTKFDAQGEDAKSVFFAEKVQSHFEQKAEEAHKGEIVE